VSIAAAEKVLNLLDEDQLDYIYEMGESLKSRLQQITDGIKEVRGKGLMIGIELVKDRTTKEPAREECDQVFEQSKEMGLLLGRGGLYSNVLRIKPPMCITHGDVDFILEVFDLVFGEL